MSWTKLFCLGQIWFCLGQKTFCPGKWTGHKPKIFLFFQSKIDIDFKTLDNVFGSEDANEDEEMLVEEVEKKLPINKIEITERGKNFLEKVILINYKNHYI